MSLKESYQFKDRLIKGISPEGYFKVSIVKTTEIVRTAQERHNLSLLNTVLLGRTLTASLLLASELKGEERIRLRLEGNGTSGMILAEANRAGEVRGYVQHPAAELDYSDESTSLSDGLGVGLLSVSKILYNEAEPRTSTIQLHKGDIITDIAHYLAQSEQIPSAVLLDTDIDDEGGVRNAGGLLLQRLPDAPEEVVEKLQLKLKKFDSIGGQLNRNIYIDRILEKAVHPYKVTELDRQLVHFFCRCSKDRFISALSMLDYEDLKDMEGESQEIVCHFCNNRIRVSPEEIHELAVNAHARLN